MVLSQDHKRVLVVEDEKCVNKAICGILRLKGLIATGAYTVKDGLEGLKQAPDLVILDIMLPDGEGTQVLEKIRRDNLPTKVIVTSGTSDEDKLNRIHAMNPDFYLPKPVNTDQFLNCVQQCTQG